MTISTQTNKVIAQGNGATVTFSYNFLIPEASEAVVIYTDTAGAATTLSSSQFTITGLGNSGGGTVTYPLTGSPIAVGTTLIITRELPLVQDASITNQGAFYPAVVEGALDYEMMCIQQINQQLGLTLRVPISDPNPARLPSVANRRNKYMAFDASGDPQALDGTSQPLQQSANEYDITNAEAVDEGGLWRLYGLGNLTSDFQHLPAAGVFISQNTAPAGDFSSEIVRMQFYSNIDQTTNIGNFSNPPGWPLGEDGSLIHTINRIVYVSDNGLLASIVFSVDSMISDGGGGFSIGSISFISANNRSGYTGAGISIPCWTDCNPLPTVPAVITIQTKSDGAGGFELDGSTLTLVSGGSGYPTSNPSAVAAGAAGPPPPATTLDPQEGIYDVGPQIELFRDVQLSSGSTGPAIYFEARNQDGTPVVLAQIACFMLNPDPLFATSSLILSSGGPYAVNAGVQPELQLVNGLSYPDPLGVTASRGLGYCDFFGYYINGVPIPDFQSSDAGGISVRALALADTGATAAILAVGSVNKPYAGGIVMPGPSNSSYGGAESINLVSIYGTPITENLLTVEARRVIYNGGSPVHLYGKTATGFGTVGIELYTAGAALWTITSAISQYYNRLGTDGSLVSFNRAGVEVGTISVNATNTAYNTSSDRALKFDLEEFDGLAMIEGADAVMARMVQNPDAPLRPVLIADEFEAMVPHAVSRNSDGYLQMDYAQASCAIMWQAIKQLKRQVEALQ